MPDVWQSYMPAIIRIFFQDNNLSKSQWILTKLDMYIDIVELCLGIAHGQGKRGSRTVWWFEKFVRNPAFVYPFQISLYWSDIKNEQISIFV